MKQLARNILILAKLAACYAYDLFRFAESALLFSPFRSKDMARAHLFRLSHALEKGLALPLPRAGFGSAKSVDLIKAVERYVDKFGVDDDTRMCVAVVQEVRQFNARHDIRHEVVEKALEDVWIRYPGLFTESRHATLSVRKAEIFAALPSNPEEFFCGRHSVRQFDSQGIKPELIERAVRLAQKAPSVCNRQTGKVYCVTDPNKIRETLTFQDGNAGFGDTVGALFVITANLRGFYKIGERNQGFVDGGLFAMSLAYAIHSLGLGACFLNWSVSAKQDWKMRRALRIPRNEVVITMMAVGHLKETFSVATAPRFPIAEALTWL